MAPWEADGKRYFTGIIRDVTQRKRREEKINVLLREVNHRSKNMLSLVQAIASQTAARDPVEFVRHFSERIRALAASQDLLVKSQWQGISIEELVKSQLAHFRDLLGDRIELKGALLRIAAPAAQSIGMALHELATNAGKYGALSTGAGRIAIAWSLNTDRSGKLRFSLRWTESGGPAVFSAEAAGLRLNRRRDHASHGIGCGRGTALRAGRTAVASRLSRRRPCLRRTTILPLSG